jgi:exodeoxyribonuclease VII small subunit
MKKEQTYEEALREIEEVVRKLEGGNLPLEESLQLYEKGVRLTKYCSGFGKGRKENHHLNQNETGEMEENGLFPRAETV